MSISRTSWAQQSIVSGPSTHVEDLVKAVEMVVDVVKDRIEQKKYLRNFLDKGAKYVRSPSDLTSVPTISKFDPS